MSGAEICLVLFGIAAVSAVVATLGIWYDIRLERRHELNELNEEYRKVILDDYRERHTFEGELPGRASPRLGGQPPAVVRD